MGEHIASEERVFVVEPVVRADAELLTRVSGFGRAGDAVGGLIGERNELVEDCRSDRTDARRRDDVACKNRVSIQRIFDGSAAGEVPGALGGGEHD